MLEFKSVLVRGLIRIVIASLRRDGITTCRLDATVTVKKER